MRTVLVVDDAIELVEMVAEYLRRDGFAVDLAHDGTDPRAETPAGYELVARVLAGSAGTAPKTRVSPRRRETPRA